MTFLSFIVAPISQNKTEVVRREVVDSTVFGLVGGVAFFFGRRVEAPVAAGVAHLVPSVSSQCTRQRKNQLLIFITPYILPDNSPLEASLESPR